MEQINQNIQVFAESQTIYYAVDTITDEVAYKTTSLEEAIDFAETTNKILEKQGV